MKLSSHRDLRTRLLVHLIFFTVEVAITVFILRSAIMESGQCLMHPNLIPGLFLLVIAGGSHFVALVEMEARQRTMARIPYKRRKNPDDLLG